MERQSLVPSAGWRRAGFRRAILCAIAIAIARNIVNALSHPVGRLTRDRARHPPPADDNPLNHWDFAGIGRPCSGHPGRGPDPQIPPNFTLDSIFWICAHLARAGPIPLAKPPSRPVPAAGAS